MNKPPLPDTADLIRKTAKLASQALSELPGNSSAWLLGHRPYLEEDTMPAIQQAVSTGVMTADIPYSSQWRYFLSSEEELAADIPDDLQGRITEALELCDRLNNLGLDVPTFTELMLNSAL